MCSPRTVFIMGGGEGSAAREAIKHKSMEKVVMCDIDEVIQIIARKFFFKKKDQVVYIVVLPGRLRINSLGNCNFPFFVLTKNK